MFTSNSANTFLEDNFFKMAVPSECVFIQGIPLYTNVGGSTVILAQSYVIELEVRGPISVVPVHTIHTYIYTHMYGPGRPFRALKHKQVSSVMTGPSICHCNTIIKINMQMT